ncbi:hypothetical protein CEXT_487971 [Caerostris extrusa]|uniref:Uncharacterized protein n=1 Tax=Caerostris extrusa TaxID=172846 RepID=A0AAV4Y249_CAEEX|nr:hypothetical protein CEXT_487971 [Caerostris extrusa]
MVSDPKLYDPNTVRALSTTSGHRHTSDPVDGETDVITPRLKASKARTIFQYVAASFRQGTLLVFQKASNK